MVESSYKLQVKLGHSEFNAEGPEDTVKEAYEKFLSVVTTVPGQNKLDSRPVLNETPEVTPESAADALLLQRAFSSDPKKRVVSLRHLPPEDPNRAANAAILILYGFRTLQQLEDVPVTRLKASLNQSGVQVDRLDRFMRTHTTLVRKGGARIGGRYSLNNLGMTQAVAWLREWYK